MLLPCHDRHLEIGIYDPERELKHVVSCTSKPQQWGKGGKREDEFHPVMTTSKEKPRQASNVSSKRKRGIHSQFCDPRPSKARHIDSDSVAKL